jgi:uncharacterized protein (TIGR02246 family)
MNDAFLAELRRHTSQAYAAADADRAADLYVDDGVQQPPGRPPVVGRTAIRESYRALFSRGGLDLELGPWETAVIGGGEARERGAYRLSMGDQLLLAGKYLFVVRETAPGHWRYVWTTVAPD